MFELVTAYDHKEEAKELFTEYTDMLVAGDSGFREYLLIQNYDSELEHLEDKYGMPYGRLLLAYYDKQLAGCIGLRKIDKENCEMKRLYVRAEFRGKKIGEYLAEEIIKIAREMDVTGLKKYVKENDLSFTLAMVYAVCKCANQIEAFRYRFVDGKIVLFDNIDTAFTYLNKKTNLFKVVNVPMMDDFKEYCIAAKKAADEQEVYFTGPLENDAFQCSPMPWVTYTHISHTNSGKKDNATPLFDWGKYYIFLR